MRLVPSCARLRLSAPANSDDFVTRTAVAAHALGDLHKVDAGYVEAGHVTHLHYLAERSHRAVAFIIDDDVVSGSFRWAAVHSAWIEYIAEPSPTRQTVRMLGRPSAMPTAAGRPWPSPPLAMV